MRVLRIDGRSGAKAGECPTCGYPLKKHRRLGDPFECVSVMMVECAKFKRSYERVTADMEVLKAYHARQREELLRELQTLRAQSDVKTAAKTLRLLFTYMTLLADVLEVADARGLSVVELVPDEVLFAIVDLSKELGFECPLEDYADDYDEDYDQLYPHGWSAEDDEGDDDDDEVP